MFDFQRPVGALIDTAETEAESHTLYHKVPALLTLVFSFTQPMKMFSVSCDSVAIPFKNTEKSLKLEAW